MISGRFYHNEQSLRVVEVLENDGQGLNLTSEVRDGILNHRGDIHPCTLEGEVVRYCDRIAYLNHDIDDAVRSGHLSYGQLPQSTLSLLGDRHSKRIDTMVKAIVYESQGQPKVVMSPPIAAAMDELRQFMFDHVYFHEDHLTEEAHLLEIISYLYYTLKENPQLLPEEYQRYELDQAVEDYIAGMTDPFALNLYQQWHG